MALRVADADGVVAVCALAPWIEPGEPVAQLAGRTVLIAHGDRERWTDPAASYSFALRARAVTAAVERFEARGAGHFMLRRAADWTGMVRAFVTGALGIALPHPQITSGLRDCTPDGLRRPFPAVMRWQRPQHVDGRAEPEPSAAPWCTGHRQHPTPHTDRRGVHRPCPRRSHRRGGERVSTAVIAAMPSATALMVLAAYQAGSYMSGNGPMAPMSTYR